jgi:hypothetical protein
VKVQPDAATATVVDLDGKVHELRELWQEHPTVLVFLRHFG